MRSSNIFNWKILALSAAIVVAFSGSVAAEVDDETREACRPDAWRLCAAFIPNVDRITECMSAKIKEVSPACRAAMIHEDNKTRARGRDASAEGQ
jgi:hypothetical protein